MKQDEAPPRTGGLQTTTWVTTSYFAQGYPYAIVNTVAETMFVEMKASLQVIGLTSLFHLPWNLKFLWAPWIDAYETKRAWLLAIEVALVVLLGLLAVLSATSASLAAISIVFAALAVVSATHDIAIDGFYLEALDETQQSRYVGVRVAAYRVALTVGAGLLVSLGGWFGWAAAWIVGAGVMVGLFALHAVLLPQPETRRLPLVGLLFGLAGRRVWLGGIVAAVLTAIELRQPFLRPLFAHLQRFVAESPALSLVGMSGWIGIGLFVVLLLGMVAIRTFRNRELTGDSPYRQAFVDFLAQPRIGRMLAFVVLFRLGESFLLKMRYPFLNQEVGMSAEYFGAVIVGAGGVASIGATLLGGHLIARDGLRRWLWPFVLAQNLLNLLYMAVAIVPDPSALDLRLVTALVALEHVGAGLGTSVFMVYLMRCCDPRHRATHMAIVTALMSLGFTLAGVLSGFIAAALGFGLYFAFTFVATIPSMLLLPFLPHLDARESIEPAP